MVSLYQSFSNHPLTVYERLFLQRQPQKRWNHARLLLFALAMAVAVTPLWLYMDTSQTPTLLVMAVVIHLAHIVVGMRTMLLAINAVTRERQAVRWDSLILTGIDARRIVWGKWWAVVRFVWKDHALMALPRVGLAFGLAQYLHMIFINSPGYFVDLWTRQPTCPYDIPFCYYSYTRFLPSFIHPQIWTTMLGALLIVAISIAEVGLIAALAQFVALTSKRYSLVYPIKVIMIRGFLAVGAIISLWGFRYIPLLPLLETHCFVSSTCVWSDHVFAKRDDTSQELWLVIRTIARIRETGQVAISPLTDTGTSLAANIMRPIGEGSEFGAYYKFDSGEQVLRYRSNLLFVLRNLVGAALGLGLYALIIVGTLRLAERAAVRRHGALRVGSR